jgi:glycosyltransferase involved in cell wall biosynthesis
MRIAIVSDYFLDYVGGAQTSMRQQQLALEEAGHTVVMVSASHSLFGPRVRMVADGIRMRPSVTMPGLQFPIIPNSARTRGILESYFREQQIDVVHVQTEFSLAHAAIEVAATIGIPSVLTVHTFYWSNEGGPQSSIAWFVRWAVETTSKWTLPRQQLAPGATDNTLRNVTLALALRVDTVISPSAHQARDLENAGVPGPVVVIPNPVATSPRPSVPLSPAQAAKPTFLWVARCEPVKRPLVFAQAAIDALASTNGGFSVDFVGDGAQLSALKKLVEGHPQLRVHGALSHDEVLDLMDASAAVVLTSLGFDNQPMTIAEAVSRERGVLYCDPKLREGLSGAGYLSETPDAAGLTTAIEALVADPTILQHLSAGAAADRNEFGPATYVERVLAVYEGIPR